jgi:hypothetical protein
MVAAISKARTNRDLPGFPWLIRQIRSPLASTQASLRRRPRGIVLCDPGFRQPPKEFVVDRVARGDTAGHLLKNCHLLPTAAIPWPQIHYIRLNRSIPPCDSRACRPAWAPAKNSEWGQDVPLWIVAIECGLWHDRRIDWNAIAERTRTSSRIREMCDRLHARCPDRLAVFFLKCASLRQFMCSSMLGTGEMLRQKICCFSDLRLRSIRGEHGRVGTEALPGVPISAILCHSFCDLSRPIQQRARIIALVHPSQHIKRTIA